MMANQITTPPSPTMTSPCGFVFLTAWWPQGGWTFRGDPELSKQVF